MKTHASISSNKGFYIGDVCYVLSDEVYFEQWGQGYKFMDGEISTNNGYDFGVAGTAYGDGCYVDQNGNCYGVDAGVIGIVPLELVEDEERANDLGTVVYGAGVATMVAEFGNFEFTLPNEDEIRIRTH